LEETIPAFLGRDYLPAVGIPDKLNPGTAMRSKELKDLVLSALLLALAFGIAFSGGLRAFSEPRILVDRVLVAIVSVSLGFVLHEMGHRFLAKRFGFFAEYTMWPAGLMLALVCSLFGFVFAAPGAVMIYPRADALGRTALSRENSGLISIAGPAMNLFLAVVFLLLNTAYPTILFSLGARINTWLAIFNLIPFGPLDGAKILGWNRTAWLAALAAGVGLFIAEFLVL
jgi:Zn-dependent protease